VARQVVLLRGVNVTGRRLAMPTLRGALADAGCRDVVTHLASGNVLLTPPEPAPPDLGGWLERTIEDVAGFPVPVVLRTGRELEATVRRNPFPGAGGTLLHVVFFATDPGPAVLEGIDLEAFRPEACALVGRELYLHLPGGMGRARLPKALERAGRTAGGTATGTSRNWNTVLALAELARR
jgi:uncharacterized protein (DUF1697 family)